MGRLETHGILGATSTRLSGSLSECFISVCSGYFPIGTTTTGSPLLAAKDTEGPYMAGAAMTSKLCESSTPGIPPSPAKKDANPQATQIFASE